MAYLQVSGDIRSEIDLEARDASWCSRNLMKTEVRNLLNQVKQTGDWQRNRKAPTTYSNAIIETRK